MNSSDAFKEANRTRFETDLEFVQCLANPFYLQTLAQQSILSSPAFLEYLNYLQYLRAPEYAKFIHYPQCLHHLELCTKSETFREAIQHDATVGELAKTQVEHWRTWRELPVVDDKATEGKTEQMEEQAVETKQAGQA